MFKSSIRNTVILAMLMHTCAPVFASWQQLVAQGVKLGASGVKLGAGVALFNKYFFTAYTGVSLEFNNKDKLGVTEKFGKSVCSAALSYGVARKKPVEFLATYYPMQYVMNNVVLSVDQAQSYGQKLGAETAKDTESKEELLYAFLQYLKAGDHSYLEGVRDLSYMQIHKQYIDGEIDLESIKKRASFRARAACEDYRDNNMSIGLGILARILFK